MSFREKIRRWRQNVSGDKCEWETYSEESGFKECGKSTKGKRRSEVHHITGEAELLARGKDPMKAEALNLCPDHHTKNTRGTIYEDDGSFHPDIGQARKQYKEWKRQEEHMKSITGRKVTRYDTSPFADVGRDHRKKAKRGERYIEGDDASDEYYRRKSKQKAWDHYLKTGEKRPDVKPHPKYKKKKSWIGKLLDKSDKW